MTWGGIRGGISMLWHFPSFSALLGMNERPTFPHGYVCGIVGMGNDSALITSGRQIKSIGWGLSFRGISKVR